jgi:hypothetical protein
MKYLKKYENIDWSEDWDEDIDENELKDNIVYLGTGYFIKQGDKKLYKDFPYSTANLSPTNKFSENDFVYVYDLKNELYPDIQFDKNSDYGWKKMRISQL